LNLARSRLFFPYWHQQVGITSTFGSQTQKVISPFPGSALPDQVMAIFLSFPQVLAEFHYI